MCYLKVTNMREVGVFPTGIIDRVFYSVMRDFYILILSGGRLVIDLCSSVTNSILWSIGMKMGLVRAQGKGVYHISGQNQGVRSPRDKLCTQFH